jgi:hypothetical protein
MAKNPLNSKPFKDYNPLDKLNLAKSVAEAMLETEVHALPPTHPFFGAGIYAIYYIGDFPAYGFVRDSNQNRRFEQPIYVGKAVPKGARKGGLGLGMQPGQALYNRLCEHKESIEAAKLGVSNFFYRYLVVDDIWIPLGEALLIDRFRPVWNLVVAGFGNHDPGAGRYKGMRSLWDVLHPGRAWAKKCNPHKKTPDQILQEIAAFSKGDLKKDVDIKKIVAEEE